MLLRYDQPMVGASGGIFGLLVAIAWTYPNHTITLLFPPLPIKLKYFALFYAVLEVVLMAFTIEGDMIAHYAHIGGGLSGFLLTVLMMRR